MKNNILSQEPLCKTCKNKFYFPKCCTENLTDCFKIITNCKNYDGTPEDPEKPYSNIEIKIEYDEEYLKKSWKIKGENKIDEI